MPFFKPKLRRISRYGVINIAEPPPPPPRPPPPPPPPPEPYIPNLTETLTLSVGDFVGKDPSSGIANSYLPYYEDGILKSHTLETGGISGAYSVLDTFWFGKYEIDFKTSGRRNNSIINYSPLWLFRSEPRTELDLIECFENRQSNQIRLGSYKGSNYEGIDIYPDIDFENGEYHKFLLDVKPTGFSISIDGTVIYDFIPNPVNLGSPPFKMVLGWVYSRNNINPFEVSIRSITYTRVEYPIYDTEWVYRGIIIRLIEGMYVIEDPNFGLYGQTDSLEATKSLIDQYLGIV